MATATRSSKRNKSSNPATARNNELGARGRKKEETPGRSLRRNPAKTRKQREYENEGNKRKKRRELQTCIENPAPSSEADYLSPKNPRTSERKSLSKKSRGSHIGKKYENGGISRALFSPSSDSKSTDKRSVKDQENIPSAANTDDRFKSKEDLDTGEDAGFKNGDGIETKDDNDVNEDGDDGKKSKEQNKTNDDNEDCLLRNTSKRGIETISPKKTVAMPKLFEGLPYSSYSDIDKNFQSSVLNFGRKETEEEVRFPFWFTELHRDDQVALRKNPEKVRDVTDLHNTTSLLDLATQWTFMDTGHNSPNEKVWCPLPSTCFGQMITGSYSEGSFLHRMWNIVMPNFDDLLSYKVIDVVVHHQGHFSRLFVLNAKVVVEGLAQYRDDGEDPVPCIIHVDSLPSSGSSMHTTERCAAKVRKFLNAYGKVEHGYKNVFREKTLPAYKIEVPRQNDFWSCPFYSLYSRYCLMKAIEEKGDITFWDTGTPEGRKSLSEQYFSYTENDVMELRSDLLYLADTMAKIKNFSNDKTKPFSFERRPDGSEEVIDLTDDIDETPDEIKDLSLVVPLDRKALEKKAKAIKKKPKYTKIKRRSSAGHQSRQDLMEMKARDDELLEFHGKLNHKKRTDQAQMVAQGKYTEQPRLKGEKARSIEAYKDAPFRRAMYQTTRSLQSLQRMTEFQSRFLNEKHPKISGIGLIYDPLLQRLHGAKKDDPLRPEPLRIAICSDQQKLDEMIKDLIENREKYQVVNNIPKIDQMIFGDHRKPLTDFIKNNRKRDVCVQDMSENKEALSKTNRLVMTPEINMKKKAEVGKMNEQECSEIFG